MRVKVRFWPMILEIDDPGPDVADVDTFIEEQVTHALFMETPEIVSIEDA